MTIEGLGEDVLVLNFTPIEFSRLEGIDTPRGFSEHFELTYLFPLAYDAGEVTLQEGLSLAEAVRTTVGCQRFDGGGVIQAVVRAKSGGRRVKDVCPWGKKPPPGAEPLDAVNVGELLEVGAHDR